MNANEILSGLSVMQMDNPSDANTLIQGIKLALSDLVDRAAASAVPGLSRVGFQGTYTIGNDTRDDTAGFSEDQILEGLAKYCSTQHRADLNLNALAWAYSGSTTFLWSRYASAVEPTARQVEQLRDSITAAIEKFIVTCQPAVRFSTVTYGGNGSYLQVTPYTLRTDRKSGHRLGQFAEPSTAASISNNYGMSIAVCLAVESFTTVIGDVSRSLSLELAHQVGGMENSGSYVERILKVTDHTDEGVYFIKTTGTYDSCDGIEWDTEYSLVRPVPKVVVGWDKADGKCEELDILFYETTKNATQGEQ